MPQIPIHVHYPPARGELVLRTELDWDQDVPGEPTADGARFVVETDRPWLYFKPCLRLDGRLHWVPGINRLAEPAPGGRHIYPYFLSPTRGALQPAEDIDGMRIRVYLPAGYAENTLSRYPVSTCTTGRTSSCRRRPSRGRSGRSTSASTSSTTST